MQPNKHMYAQVHLLIAPGFEEDFVVNCLVLLREAGVGVALVGVTRGEVVGAHGVAMCPDFILEEAGHYLPPQLIGVPGGQRCVNMLMIDPRFHQMLKDTIESGGVLALAKEAQHLAQAKPKQLCTQEIPQILYQGDMEQQIFLNYMLHIIKQLQK